MTGESLKALVVDDSAIEFRFDTEYGLDQDAVSWFLD